MVNWTIWSRLSILIKFDQINLGQLYFFQFDGLIRLLTRWQMYQIVINYWEVRVSDPQGLCLSLD